MAIQGFDDFEERRRPWWILALVLILAAAGGAYLWVSGRSSGGESEPDRKTPLAGAESPRAGNETVPAASSQTGGLAQASISARDLVSQASALEQGGAPAAAREKLLQALQQAGDAPFRVEIEAALGRIGTKLLFAPFPMPEKTEYTVQPGDAIAKIAQKYGTTPELVQKGNHIANPKLIKVGDRLRVLSGKFSVSVSRPKNELALQLNDRFFKRYRVGTGKFSRTPTGTFFISERVKEPVWWRPDGKPVPYGEKENILGTHWLTLKSTGQTEDVRGYGIHGTWETNSVGQSETAGCIRLLNEDIEELYTLLPVSTPVTISD